MGRVAVASAALILIGAAIGPGPELPLELRAALLAGALVLLVNAARTRRP